MSQRPARVQRFSTRDLPVDRRFTHWAREFGRTLGYASLESPDAADFRQSLTQVDMGLTRFLRLRGSPTSSHASAGALDEAELRPYQLLIRIGAGTTSLVQGRAVEIAAGDMVLLDARQAFSLRSQPSTDLLAVAFPESLAARWLPHARDAVAQRLAGGSGWAATLSAYLRALDTSLLEHITSAFEEELVCEHMLSMLSFALAQHDGFRPADKDRVPPRDRVLHARMCDWLRDNYSNPDISAAMLARQFNVSVRYVHKVFAGAGQGVTFGEALKHQRLEAAVRMLRTANVSRTFVAQIAERCGFSDPAYFGLVFRKAYGCSPGSYAQRAAALSEPSRRTEDKGLP